MQPILQQFLQDYSVLSNANKQFRDSEDYQYDMDCMSRRFFFMHLYKILNRARTHLQIQKKQRDDNCFLPEIKKDDDALQLAKQSTVIIIDTIRLYSQVQYEQIFTPSLIKTMIWRQHKRIICMILFFFVLQLVCRLIFSILLQWLFQAVSNMQFQKDAGRVYGLAISLGVIRLLSLFGKNNGFYEVSLLTARVRSQMLLLIYARLSLLSQYTAKKQQLGKIINLISNDFNTIEIKTADLFAGLTVPLGLIFTIAILLERFGLAGLIIPGVILAYLPLQIFVSHYNGQFTRQINKHKDQRVKIWKEVIETIKLIKIYALERQFRSIIRVIRSKEAREYFKIALGRSLEKSLGNMSASSAGVICFAVISLKNLGSLSNSAIFSTLDLLVTLKQLIVSLSLGITFVFELEIIFERISNVLNIKDQRMLNVHSESKINQPEHVQIELRNGEIVYKNFSLYWGLNNLDSPNIKNLNLHIKEGQFLGVTGKIGSGKSSMFAPLVQQVPYYSGIFLKSGRIGYVQQQPILFTGSIKENIIGGMAYERTKYFRCLSLSCLNEDMDRLDMRDDTLVIQRGMNLSGGQKVRISFARALYMEPDIYLFDDPLSSLDSKVGMAMYQNGILQLKGKKTVILISHKIQILRQCDRVLTIQDGQVLKGAQEVNLRKQSQNQDASNIQLTQLLESGTSSAKSLWNPLASQNFANVQPMSPEQQKNNTISQGYFSRWKSYLGYLLQQKLNLLLVPLCLVCFLSSQVLSAIYTRFLSEFDETKSQSATTTFHSLHQFWFGLISLQSAILLLSVIKYFLLNIVVVNSNQVIQKKMINSIIRAPISYFDKTSSGSLSNKYSNDLGLMDYAFWYGFTQVIQNFIVIGTLLINIFSINGYFVLLGSLNLFFIVFLLNYCTSATLRLRQADLKMKTPIFSMMSEMLSTLTQINLFSRRLEFIKRFWKSLDQSFRVNICYWNLARVFTGALGNNFTIIIVTIGWTVGIALLKPQKVGIYEASVVFLIQLSNQIYYILKQVLYLESMMVSYQRVSKLTNLVQEKQLISDYDIQSNIVQDTGLDRSENGDDLIMWPGNSTIKLRNFSMRYRPQLPCVLKNISITIRQRQRVGIVGRTGAGKSSVVQALLRIYEPEPGSEYQLGGFEGLKMGLHTLRKSISVITQTPYLFQGTIRYNLDPSQSLHVERIWQVLDQVNLKFEVLRLPNQLETDYKYFHGAFSIGQKQLLCLARALLKQKKFLILDEATAYVDESSEKVIEKCLERNFQSTTIVAIAHKIQSIIGYDKIVVMGQGTIQEIGSPKQLITKQGLFAQMVKRSSHLKKF